MKDFNIYLAGGMGKFGKDKFRIGNNWRVYCKNIIDEYSTDKSVNVTVINPNDYFNFIDEPQRYESQREVMEFDLYKVRNSNLLIVNFNDVFSLGTMAELSIAYDRRIPVIGLNVDNTTLHPWQKEMCTRVFTDVDMLLDYVKEFYIT